MGEEGGDDEPSYKPQAQWGSTTCFCGSKNNITAEGMDARLPMRATFFRTEKSESPPSFRQI
jgi:hypothetical protein